MASMSDVARAAGVSAATVSRALRGEPGVSDATRRYVTEVAERMRYAIARDASSLAGGRRYAVGVLTAEGGRGDLLAGAEAALRDAGYDVLLYVLRDRAAFFERLPPARRVDGLVALGVTLSADETGALAGLDVPLVEAGQDDPHDALRVAADHLVSLGHRDVALVLTEDADESYDDVLVAAGLATRPEWTLWSSPTVAGGEQAVEVLFDGGGRPPTAIVTAHAAVAIGVLLRLRRDGRDVPRDVSIVSLDDCELVRTVGVTAVEGAWRDRGARAATSLLTTLGVRAPDTAATVRSLVGGSVAVPGGRV
ncbi:LacI family DNA-binding transcriptional regulator [Saccharothrix violaceirubra]